MLEKLFFVAGMMLCSFTLPIMAFAAAVPYLPPEQFLSKGAGVLIGEIVDVQVLEQEQGFESGTIVVTVIEVLSGNVEATVLDFPYRRQLGPVIINGSGWDLVSPERGKKVVIYFSEKDGVYSLSGAGQNSIEEVSSLNDPKIETVRAIIGH